MNFLAHIYLSNNNSDLVKIGNFMADGIKGKNFLDYHPEIQKGILLHRAIDTYTDAHPIFRQSTKRLHSKYHHYSGVIVDIFYDHFLAKNWSIYSEETLENYLETFYQILIDNFVFLSDKMKIIAPKIIKNNWLLSYRTIENIDFVLERMDLRTKGQSNMRFSGQDLREFYPEFEQEFLLFFEDIRKIIIN